MARPLTHKEIKEIKKERELDSRRRLAEHLMWDWREWYKVTPLNTRAYGIIDVATRTAPANYLLHGIEASSIHLHLSRCAYHVITHQPLTCREVELPGHEKQMVAWRIAQGIIFFLLFYGIKPIDWEDDIVLSRGWIFFLFLAFVAISAWCRYCDKWYNEHQRETATLNAAVTEADIAAYLRSSECAEMMKKELDHQNCEHTSEIKEYLRWYESAGKETQQIVKNYRLQFTEEEYNRLQRVLKLPHLCTIAPELYDLRKYDEEKLIHYCINKMAKENDITPEESEDKYWDAEEYHEHIKSRFQSLKQTP